MEYVEKVNVAKVYEKERKLFLNTLKKDAFLLLYAREFGYKFIARDQDGDTFLYEKMPVPDSRQAEWMPPFGQGDYNPVSGEFKMISPGQCCNVEDLLAEVLSFLPKEFMMEAIYDV